MMIVFVQFGGGGLSGGGVEFEFGFQLVALEIDGFVELLEDVQRFVLRGHEADQQVLPDRHPIANPADLTRINHGEYREDG